MSRAISIIKVTIVNDPCRRTINFVNLKLDASSQLTWRVTVFQRTTKCSGTKGTWRARLPSNSILLLGTNDSSDKVVEWVESDSKKYPIYQNWMTFQTSLMEETNNVGLYVHKFHQITKRRRKKEEEKKTTQSM